MLQKIDIFFQPRDGELTLTFPNTQSVCARPDGDSTIDVLQLKQYFSDNGFGWTLPHTFHIPPADQNWQGTDSIEISFSDRSQPLFRDMVHAINGNWESIELDDDFDKNMELSALTDKQKKAMREEKGGGFLIDSILVKFVGDQAESIIISATRVPPATEPDSWYGASEMLSRRSRPGCRSE